MLDDEIVVLEVYNPSHLSPVDVLCLMEVCQVLVVCQDLHNLFGSFEVVRPFIECVDMPGTHQYSYLSNSAPDEDFRT